MAHGLSNGHMTDDVTWPRRCCEAVRSAILATAWFLVRIRSRKAMLEDFVSETRERNSPNIDGE